MKIVTKGENNMNTSYLKSCLFIILMSCSFTAIPNWDCDDDGVLENEEGRKKIESLFRGIPSGFVENNLKAIKTDWMKRLERKGD